MRAQAKRRDAAAQSIRLGQRGDAQEREAESAAASIMRGNECHAIARAATPTLQASASGSAGAAPANLSRAAGATRSGGQPLPNTERRFFEQRFDRNLSAVRVHIDSRAGRAAQDIGASAYTLGSHIAFAPGNYRPHTPDGRHLLAHEITHTLQQGGVDTIRRTCPSDPASIPPGGSKDFEKAVDDIRALKVYSGLDASAKAKADHIIDGARASACPMYYITKLRALMDTVEDSPAKVGKKFRGKARKAEAKEKARLTEQDKLSKAVGSDITNLEEDEAARRADRMRVETGRQNKTFLIDDSDVTNIYIHMKVLPRPATRRTKSRKKEAGEDVERTKGLEDGIEVSVLSGSYMLNLEFSTKPGPDVFEVKVDPESWPTSGNWISNATTLAHEAHHLLGLEDRYNYIESHAKNPKMKIASRLHWFREQMVRGADPLAGLSKMRKSSSSAAMNEEDICALVDSNYRSCLVQRYALRPAHELESVAGHLNAPYRPQHAALLSVLSDSWQQRPKTERTRSCDVKLATCGKPPDAIFIDAGRRATDEGSFPLANPHDQKPGSSLTRKARP